MAVRLSILRVRRFSFWGWGLGELKFSEYFNYKKIKLGLELSKIFSERSSTIILNFVEIGDQPENV
jgi:hypothetical protein